jgi:hypothetical protein
MPGFEAIDVPSFEHNLDILNGTHTTVAILLR